MDQMEVNHAEGMQAAPSKIVRFEDLIAWQRARGLVAEVYRATGSGSFAKDFALIDQLRRAAFSVSSNIAEGFDRRRRSEFHHSLIVAKGSCAQVQSLLYVALDAGYLDEAEFGRLYEEANEVAKLVAGLRKAVERQLQEESRSEA